MSDEKLCSQGHVIEAYRETCSRCNGMPVNVPPVPPPQDNEHVAEGAEKFDEPEPTAQKKSPQNEEVQENEQSSQEQSEVPPSESQQDEQSQPEAEQQKSEESSEALG